MTPDDLILGPMGLRFQGRRYPCTIGRSGLTDQKREGDGATPKGVHKLVGILYRPERVAKPSPWAIPIGPLDLWSDDPEDASYNLMVRAPYPASHEALRRADPLYDIVLLTDWNWPHPIKGRGSAIFIHQWRRPGFATEGCIALKRVDLHGIAKCINPGANLVIR